MQKVVMFFLTVMTCLIINCGDNHKHNADCEQEINGVVKEVKYKKASGCSDPGQLKFFFKDGRILTLHGLDKNVSYSVEIGRRYQITFCTQKRVVTNVKRIK